MLYYFYGPDTYGARQEIDRMAQEQTAIIRWLDEDLLIERSLGDWLSQGQGLWGKDLFVLRDPSGWAAARREALLDVVSHEMSAEAVIWERRNIDKRSSLHNTLKARGRLFSALNEGQVVQWLVQQAKEEGGKIEPAAARIMVMWLGADRWRLQAELRRLLLGKDSLDVAAVREQINQPLQAEMFNALDHIVRGNKPQALRAIETLLEQGNSEFYILTMLGYQYRTLLLVSNASKNGGRTDDIARATKLHPYVVQKDMEVLRLLNEDKIEEALTRIAATDFAIKRGKMDARTGLLMLVQGLVGK